MSPESVAYASTLMGKAFPAPPTGNAPIAPVEDDPAPAQIGDRYHVVRFLGKGGFGTVYEAVDERLDKHVAVKLLANRRGTSGNAFERFQAEALATSRLSHPSIVAVTDFALLPDGRPYLVMEYVSGETLHALLLRETSLPVATAVRIAQGIAGALAAAHGSGIIHRDLKPANIIVNQTTDGVQVKILDFGVAKLAATNTNSSLTKTGHIIGTPAYMAPEQVREKHGPVDGRSDLYALGMVLYEMLTGQTAFPGNSVSDVMMAHLMDRPQPPSAHRKDLPEGLDAVVLRALAKQPQCRYRDAAAFAQALGEYSSEVAVRRRFGQRMTVRVLLASALALALLVSLGRSRRAPVVDPLPVARAALPVVGLPQIQTAASLPAKVQESSVLPTLRAPRGGLPLRKLRQRVPAPESTALPDAPLASFRARGPVEARLDPRAADKASAPAAQPSERLKVDR